MKVTYRHGPVSFEKECATRADAFVFIAAIGEAFPAEPCGCCKGTNTAPTCQKWEDKTFRKMKCRDCGAELLLVFWPASEKGPEKIFPQRQDRDKKPLPNKGWSVYKGKEGEKPQHAASESGEVEAQIPF